MDLGASQQYLGCGAIRHCSKGPHSRKWIYKRSRNEKKTTRDAAPSVIYAGRCAGGHAKKDGNVNGQQTLIGSTRSTLRACPLWNDVLDDYETQIQAWRAANEGSYNLAMWGSSSTQLARIEGKQNGRHKQTQRATERAKDKLTFYSTNVGALGASPAKKENKKMLSSKTFRRCGRGL